MDDSDGLVLNISSSNDGISSEGRSRDKKTVMSSVTFPKLGGQHFQTGEVAAINFGCSF